MGDNVNARSKKGKAILEHAFSDGGRILQFERTETGELRVMDVTNHHNELQDFYNQEHETDGTDNPVRGTKEL